MKTSELTGAALDWAVLVAVYGKHDAGNIQHVAHFLHMRGENPAKPVHPMHREFLFSEQWSQGGPIIEHEKIDLVWQANPAEEWAAYPNHGMNDEFVQVGPTPLIAAMRCYVASLLGDEIETPKELL